MHRVLVCTGRAGTLAVHHGIACMQWIDMNDVKACLVYLLVWSMSGCDPMTHNHILPAVCLQSEYEGVVMWSSTTNSTQ